MLAGGEKSRVKYFRFCESGRGQVRTQLLLQIHCIGDQLIITYLVGGASPLLYYICCFFSTLSTPQTPAYPPWP